jgi:HD-like signal output (HDOD) protein
MDGLTRGLVHHYVLKPWDETDFRTLVHHSLARIEMLRKQRLEGILRSMETLPSPPSLNTRVWAVLTKEGSSVADITREIQKSPSIVAKLLRVANSVYFASRRPIASIHDAVFFIGTEYIGGLVAAIEAFQGFVGASQRGIHDQIEKLWMESFARAVIAKKVAERWEGFEERDTVFVSSLLQDIGYAVFICFAHEAYGEFLKARSAGVIPSESMEQRIFGHSHAAVGAALLEYWNLPPAIVAAVARQHQSTGGDVLLRILQIADVLCHGATGTPHDPAIGDEIALWRAKLEPEIVPVGTESPA